MIGLYFDPKHGGCLRTVSEVGRGLYSVHGVYGDDEGTCKAGTSWVASMRVLFKGSEGRLVLSVDFGHKSTNHSQRYKAVYNPNERYIEWQDGNKWFKTFCNKEQLLHAARDRIVPSFRRKKMAAADLSCDKGNPETFSQYQPTVEVAHNLNMKELQNINQTVPSRLALALISATSV